ncbi:MAG: P-II family nitrogen regulator [Deltaproteobacteria bacterium]|nr:P-II family nitrogen regulator [Deltaproteobacteria bacterium]
MSENTTQASPREMLICVLNEPDCLHEVLTALVEAGVPSSTVIETQGMGRILSQDVPIFAGFRHLFAGSKPFNNTIFAVVDGPEVTRRVITLLQDVLSDVAGSAKGIVFSLPVSQFASLNKELP